MGPSWWISNLQPCVQTGARGPFHFTKDLRPKPRASAPQPRRPLTAHASGKASTAPRPAVASPRNSTNPCRVLTHLKGGIENSTLDLLRHQCNATRLQNLSLLRQIWSTPNLPRLPKSIPVRKLQASLEPVSNLKLAVVKRLDAHATNRA